MLVFGLLIALIGIVAMAGYGEARTTIREKSIATTTKSWNLNCTLTAGDNVTFVFREHALWVEGYFEPNDDGVAVLLVYVDITPIDPQGNTTEFEVPFAVTDPQTGSGVGIRRLVLWPPITETQKGSIDTSVMLDNKSRYTGAGGTIPFNGTYEARLHVYPPRNATQPPSFLGFYHNATVTEYPNSYLLPVGGATVAFGGTVSFLAAKDSIHRYRARTKSRKVK
jgi:hypothetical protein